MSVSFYSIGPVLCDELFENTCYRIHHTEHFYTVLPFFLVLFGIGLIIFLKSVDFLRVPPRRILAIICSIIAILVSVTVLYGSQPYILDINEIKQEYKSMEPITFGISTIGFGNVCSAPHVQIVRIDRPWPQDGSNIIWSNSESGCIGDAQYKFFNHFWSIDEITGTGPLYVKDAGMFELRVSHGNKQTEKQFVIAP